MLTSHLPVITKSVCLIEHGIKLHEVNTIFFISRHKHDLTYKKGVHKKKDTLMKTI